MLQLANAELRIDLVDPANDRHLLGTRYCTGGYIWQVSDPHAGPLLTGPQWPNPTPSPFDGQGLPESFRHRTRDGRPLTWHGLHGVALGIGELTSESNGDVILVRPCDWFISRADDRLTFETRESVAGFAYALLRSIMLSNRTVTSQTRLTNEGDAPLLLEWFAHPFFALTNGYPSAEVPSGTTMRENAGFSLAGTSLTQKRRFEHHNDGHMDFLQLPPSTAALFQLGHPALTGIRFSTSFAPSECVIWGNDVTFSIEPYQTLVLGAGETREWTLRYDFGESSRIVSPTDSARTPERE